MVGAVGASPPWNWLTELGKHGLAREEQRRIGMIIAKIVSVVVEPDHRRQGVGRKLLLHTIAFYRQHHYKWMYGQFSDDSLIEFYKELGFTVSDPDQPLNVPVGIRTSMLGGSGERWFSMLL